MRRLTRSISLLGILATVCVVICVFWAALQGPNSAAGLESTDIFHGEHEGTQSRFVTAPTERREQVPETKLLATVERGTRIEVRAAGGGLVAGASIFTKGVGDWVERGKTDGAGVVELELEPGSSVEIVARAQGFVPGLDRSEPPHAAEQTLVLEPGDRICGVALSGTGAPPVKPVRVLAYSRERELVGVARSVARLVENDPSLLITTTDESGAFCIDGARRGELHVLACGGNGYADRRGTTTVQAGKSDVSISLTRLFGVAFQFIDSTGVEEVRSLGGSMIEGWCEAPDSRAHSATGVDVWLAGLDPKWTSVPSGMLLWVFSSDTESETLGAIRLDHELAGFAAGVERVNAGTVAAEIPTHVVALEPTHFGRATVEIVFTSRADAGSAVRVRDVKEGLLRLTDQDRHTWDFLVKPGNDGRAQVQGVPCGRYRARYVSQPFQFPSRTEPAIELLVDAVAGAKLEVPLDGTGWVRLSLRRKDGTAYSGQVQLALFDGEHGQRGEGEFRTRLTTGRSVGAPYVIEGLAPGRYTAFAHMPTFRSESGSQFIVLDVRDGQETVVSAAVAD